MVVTAALFVWSAAFFFGDLLGMRAVRLSREIAPGPAGLEWAARRGVPRIALVGDVAFALLSYAAACAVSGLRVGLDDLSAGYCEGLGEGWCRRMTAAAVFAFLAATLVAASAALNAANSIGPW